jgi:hypothetical protein
MYPSPTVAFRRGSEPDPDGKISMRGSTHQQKFSVTPLPLSKNNPGSPQPLQQNIFKTHQSLPEEVPFSEKQYIHQP